MLPGSYKPVFILPGQSVNLILLNILIMTMARSALALIKYNRIITDEGYIIQTKAFNTTNKQVLGFNLAAEINHFSVVAKFNRKDTRLIVVWSTSKGMRWIII
jgi:hypothetical protein